MNYWNKILIFILQGGWAIVLSIALLLHIIYNAPMRTGL